MLPLMVRHLNASAEGIWGLLHGQGVGAACRCTMSELVDNAEAVTASASMPPLEPGQGSAHQTIWKHSVAKPEVEYPRAGGQGPRALRVG